ncbi:hypothetical protein ACSFBI_33560 [Variovorax sp. RB3P1]|uniref:hypothetical protein n=1 Tax=Variovorax sp. RB3P1 TaxID=3443732 RepID=UPI003F47C9A8
MMTNLRPQSLPKNWVFLAEDEARRISEELTREVCSAHRLHGVAAKAVARHARRDDFLFAVGLTQPKYVVVHLTWNVESSPEWPAVTDFLNEADFRQSADARLYG